MIPDIPAEKLHSQKGKGLKALTSYREDALECGLLPGDAKIPLIMALLAHYQQSNQDTLFVRPCPETPNHGASVAGFQSMPIPAKALGPHLWRVRQAILQQGIKADVAIMPYIDADLSAVAAPKKYIIWGSGNAGVTAGTSRSVVVPIKEGCESFIHYAGLSPDEVEIEFVRGKDDSLYCVQIRKASGHFDISPAPEGAVPGFVAVGKVTVERIYVVKNLDDVGDLEHLKEGDTHGLLVVQPTGSMLSHAAAHCRGAKIAFMIGGEAKVGDVVTESASGWVVVGDVTPNPYNPEQYKNVFLKGFHTKLDWNMMKLGTFFHQFATAPLNDPRQTAYLAGMYIHWLVQAAITAFCGESRHTGRVSCNDPRWKDVSKDINKGFVKMTGTQSYGRSDILESLKDSDVSVDEMLTVAKFNQALFDLEWHGGYGGEKWRICADHCVDLLKAIQAGNFSAMIEKANALENGVHNNGRLYNKFSESLRWLDFATGGGSLDHQHVRQSAEIASLVLSAKWIEEPVSKGDTEDEWKTAVGFGNLTQTLIDISAHKNKLKKQAAQKAKIAALSNKPSTSTEFDLIVR